MGFVFEIYRMYLPHSKAHLVFLLEVRGLAIAKSKAFIPDVGGDRLDVTPRSQCQAEVALNGPS